MNRDLTASRQDYLEAMLELEQSAQRIGITAIADKLGLTKASVSQAVQELIKQGLVHQEKYGPVYFTQEGRQEALNVQRRHQAIYDFLVHILGVDPHIAEEDACVIEHGISTETLQHLIAFLDKEGINSRGDV